MLSLIDGLYSYTLEYPTYINTSSDSLLITWKADGRNIEPIHMELTWLPLCERIPPLCEEQYVPQIGYINVAVYKRRRKRWVLHSTHLFLLRDYFITKECTSTIKFVDLQQAADEVYRLISIAKRVDGTDFIILSENAQRTVEFIPGLKTEDNECFNFPSNVREPDFECSPCQRTQRTFPQGVIQAAAPTVQYDVFRVNAYLTYETKITTYNYNPQTRFGADCSYEVVSVYPQTKPTGLGLEWTTPQNVWITYRVFTTTPNLDNRAFALGAVTKSPPSSETLGCYYRQPGDYSYDTIEQVSDGRDVYRKRNTNFVTYRGTSRTISYSTAGLTGLSSGGNILVCGPQTGYAPADVAEPYPYAWFERIKQLVTVRITEDYRGGKLIKEYSYEPCQHADGSVTQVPLPTYNCTYDLAIIVTLSATPVTIKWTYQNKTYSYKPPLELSFEIGRIKIQGGPIEPTVESIGTFVFNQALNFAIDIAYKAAVTAAFPGAGAYLAATTDINVDLKVLSKVCV